MSDKWLLRQDPESPVIIAHALVEEPGRLAFVVLDDDDDWFVSDGAEFDEDMEVNRRLFGAMSLREAVELLPQLTALASVPTGVAADWDAGRATWLLSSVADSDDAVEDRAIREARVAAWPHPGSPVDEVQLSTGLTEIGTGKDAPSRAVRQVVREPDGSWLFVGFEVPEEQDFEVESLELEHAVRLYPEVTAVLQAAPGQVFDRAEPGAEWELVEG
ncbi:hypothetical protein GCM10022222_16190 [Amycolatopsis ultiminotia]|uniref:DUF2185 domain-containing protein n=1 Tax=Amycolatopsis ultiminotia TaxID=543629 RepID=A0ABP6VF08_9PSEU